MAAEEEAAERGDRIGNVDAFVLVGITMFAPLARPEYDGRKLLNRASNIDKGSHVGLRAPSRRSIRQIAVSERHGMAQQHSYFSRAYAPAWGILLGMIIGTVLYYEGPNIASDPVTEPEA